MELPDASSINSPSHDHRISRSTTSIDELELCFPTRNPRPARRAGLQSPHCEQQAFVTSIEYLVDDPPKNADAIYKAEEQSPEIKELSFIRKVPFDREKFFKLHFKIEQPENQLIKETLSHFQKKSENASDFLDGSSLGRARKLSEAICGPQNQKRVPHVQNMDQRDYSETDPQKERLYHQLKIKNSGKKVLSVLSGQFKGSGKLPKPFEKENEPPNNCLKRSSTKNEAINSSFKLTKDPILQYSVKTHSDLKTPRLFKNPSDNFRSQLSSKKSQSSLSANQKKSSHPCKCQLILLKLEETNRKIETDLFAKIMDRLSTVSKDLSAIESQYACHKAESHLLKAKLQTIDEFPELTQKPKTRARFLKLNNYQSSAFRSQNALVFQKAPQKEDSALKRPSNFQNPFSRALTSRGAISLRKMPNLFKL